MNKCKKTGVFKFLLIFAITMAMTLSGNAQNIATYTKDVLSTKDSTTTEKKVVQTPIDSVDLKSKPSLNQKDKDDIYTLVDIMPLFPGDDNALFKFISQHIRYPSIPKSYGIEGRVIVGLVVNKFGKVEKVSVVRGVDPYLDYEAKRVIKSLPDFTPGQLEGKNVSVWFTIPITFNLYNSY